MNLFAALLLGHLIGDFPLQTNRIAQSKHESLRILFVHVLIHVCLVAALIKNPFENILLLVMIGCSHYLIDLTKVNSAGVGASRSFLFDQIVHIASLSIITFISLNAQALPINALPTTVLYPALAYALLLGGMVFAWIWANELTMSPADEFGRIFWIRSRMLVLSQQAGVALVGVILVALFIK